MANGYWTWIAPDLNTTGVGHLVDAARTEPEGTIRILYPPHADPNKRGIAFVNGGPGKECWLECDGCYAVEEQCPEHGTHVTLTNMVTQWHGELRYV